MSNEEKKDNFAKPILAVVLILGRYLVAFGLSMLPIIIGLKGDSVWNGNISHDTLLQAGFKAL